MEAGLSGRAVRALAVLAVVLGVLAMHGLTGGHHGAASVGPAATAGADADHGAQPHAAEHDLLAAAATAPVHELVGGCHADCSERASGLLLLCIAVLLAVVSAVSLRRVSGARRIGLDAGPSQHVRTRATVPRRRLDLVADLCISRT